MRRIGLRVPLVVAALLAAASMLGATGGDRAAAARGVRAHAAANPLDLTLRANHRTITYNQSVTLTGTLNPSGLYFEQVADLQADSTYSPWRVVGEITITNSGPSTVQYAPIQIDRNTLFRLHVPYSNQPYRPDSYSPTVEVYVLPQVSLRVNPTGRPYQLIAIYDAQIHPVDHFPRQRVFFYVRPGHSRGRFSRLASKWLDYWGSGELQAAVTFRATRAVDVLACVRHRLLSDMGPPFFAPACGRPHLSVRQLG